MAMLMRKSTPIFQKQALFAATRGGFHGPDPKPYAEYKYTRRYHLEDINTVLYHDYAPEYHMHLHSIQIKNSKEGMALIAIYFCLIIMPVWLTTRQLHKLAGSMIYPSVRPGPDHAHMGPRLINHLKENNFENSKDFFGRQNAIFYRNFCRQEMGTDMKPDVVKALCGH